MIGLVLLVASASADHDHQDHKHVFDQLNQIFLWELADKLKLDPGREKNMVDLVKRCQGLREAALVKQDQGFTCLRELEKKIASAGNKTINKDAEADKCLQLIDEAEAELAKIQVNEKRKLRSLFSPYQLGRFKILRGDIIKNVRKAISKK